MKDEDKAEVLYQERAKLYRFREEWKERGLGTFKLYKHNETGKVTMVLRQEGTFKVMANFYSKFIDIFVNTWLFKFIVASNPLCDLNFHNGSLNKLFFTAYDCSDGTPTLDKFVIAFKTQERNITNIIQ